jgi:hypothetical protein
MYDIGDVDGDSVTGRLDYTNSNKFLANMGRNSLLLHNAEDVHRDLDGFDPGSLGVTTYNIVGCGTPTIGKILANKKSFKDDFEYHLKYISGDGTVPMRSAEGISSSYQYYANGVEHATMPSQSGVKDLVSAIMTNTDTEFSYKDTANISSGSDNCKIPDGKIISIHSPVALHIYDPDGHHTGPTDNGDIEYGVMGVVYDTLEDNKFAYIPDSIDVEIKINATGTGHIGIDVQSYADGEISKSEVYDNIMVDNMNAKGEIVLADESSVLFDKDGTGQNKILKADKIIQGDIPTTQIQDDTSEPSTVADTTSTKSGSRKAVPGVLQPNIQDVENIKQNVDVAVEQIINNSNKEVETKIVASDKTRESVELKEDSNIQLSASVGDSKIFTKIFKFVRDFVVSVFNKIISYLL